MSTPIDDRRVPRHGAEVLVPTLGPDGKVIEGEEMTVAATTTHRLVNENAADWPSMTPDERAAWMKRNSYEGDPVPMDRVPTDEEIAASVQRTVDDTAAAARFLPRLTGPGGRPLGLDGMPKGTNVHLHAEDALNYAMAGMKVTVPPARPAGKDSDARIRELETTVERLADANDHLRSLNADKNVFRIPRGAWWDVIPVDGEKVWYQIMYGCMAAAGFLGGLLALAAGFWLILACGFVFVAGWIFGTIRHTAKVQASLFEDYEPDPDRRLPL